MRIYDFMADPNGPVTNEELQRYYAARKKEQPFRETLQRRERYILHFMETNFNTLDYYRRYVEAIERIIHTFREEELWEEGRPMMPGYWRTKKK